ncbi:MAG: hypothetical protein IJQ85_04425 [Selenomonadaceae bacterium]|nr:hypothetical protein [Selenomonadaceae bacterium]
MPEWLKNILQRELDEIKQNKVRVIFVGVCFIVVLILWLTDGSSDDEEIILNEPTTPVETPPATKDLPVKILPVEKSSDGVTLVLGANADELFIGDPFAVKEKPKPPPKVATPPVPPIVIQPPPTQPPVQPKPQPQEKIILTGTAISGDKKIAMFLREKETLFLSIGDEIGGKKISDINPDFVILEDDVRVFIQKELR